MNTGITISAITHSHTVFRRGGLPVRRRKRVKRNKAARGLDAPTASTGPPRHAKAGHVKLFSFWRSLATFRVRIALNLKGLVPDEVVEVNLMQGKQREEAYRKVNPQMVLPALVDGDGPVLFQSLAIMEYLDETHPEPPLLPKDPRGRRRVRALAHIVACDSHPLLVPRVREYLKLEHKLDEPTRLKFI